MSYPAQMLGDLARSGIDAATAAAAGFVYEDFTNSYRIPYHDPDGRINGFHRHRFLDPAAKAKYTQPANTPPHTYLPPIAKRTWREIAQDTSESIVITEGEKKALCACLNGFTTIGLGGVDSWRSAKKGIALLPELATIEWRGRVAFIVFDKDPKPKTQERTRLAAEALATELRSRGATVHIVALPDGEDGKVGLDDFLVARGPAALRALLDSAVTRARQAYDEGVPIYQRMEDVMATPIHWLWRDRIARGKPTLIVGNPGLGKSQITISLAATVTTGGAFHDGAKCEPGNVIMLSAEDDAASTLKPRLAAAGADLTRVFLLRGVRDDDAKGERPFNLGRDLPRLKQMLDEIGGAAMVIIDPVSAYLGNVDSHRNSEVRALLMPLSGLAESSDAAFVCVSHLNKGGDSAALLRVTGSLAFVAAARAAYVVVEDKDHPGERRLFLPLKNNLGKDTTGFAFAVQGRNLTLDGQSHSTSCVVWEKEPVATTADDALAKVKKSDATALNAAQDFLRAALASGPVQMKVLEADARGAGHAWATVRRAKDELGVVAEKEPGEKGRWVWKLPVRKY